MRRGRRKRRRHVRLVVAVVGLALVAPAVYSYTTTMMQPSSLPLWPRSVEWLRAHHGNWLVDEVEHYYYSWKAPKKGGPQLTTLPSVAVPARQAAINRARRSLVDCAAADQARLRTSVGRRGVNGRGTGPLVRGSPAAFVTEFRTEVDYPRIVAYVAWFDHTRTSTAFYPGRYEPPNAPVRGPMSVPDAQRWRLLATFNGGFIYSDGHNGSSIGGKEYEPLKDGLATMIAYRDGRVDIKTLDRRPRSGAEDRVRAAEPAADRRPRPPQPGARQQHRSGATPSATRCACGAPAPGSTATAT